MRALDSLTLAAPAPAPPTGAAQAAAYPRPPRIVAFAGRKGVGKDTAALALRCFGYKRLQFAAPIKAMLSALLARQGADLAQVTRMVEGDLKETPSPLLGGRSPRHALKTLGAEWARDHIGGAFLVDCARRAIAAAPERRFVLSDARAQNEIDLVRELGGVAIRISRPGEDKSDTHRTEAAIDAIDVDIDIVNDAPDASAFRARIVNLYLTGLRQS